MNNKLLVGGILCNQEKGFDYVDHGILFSELKFCEIKGKKLAFYKFYLHNRYFRTAIYNDSDKADTVSGWEKVRYGIPQGSTFSLPKINKNSIHINFADFISILFSHSSLIDFKKKTFTKA